MIRCKQTPLYIDGATVRGAAGTTSLNIAVPASALDNRLVLVHAFGNDQGDTIAPPGGFATILDDGAATNRNCLFGKLCSGESGNWTFTKTGVGGAWRLNSAIIEGGAVPTVADLVRGTTVPVNHSMPTAIPNSLLIEFLGQETASPTVIGNPVSSAGTGSVQMTTSVVNTGTTPGCLIFYSLPGGAGGATEGGTPWLKGLSWTETSMNSSSTAAFGDVMVLVPPL